MIWSFKCPSENYLSCSKLACLVDPSDPSDNLSLTDICFPWVMTSFISHRKNTSPTKYTFVRWIHPNHRKVDLSDPSDNLSLTDICFPWVMTSFIFHRKNTSPTEYTFVRWIHLNHRKVDLSIGVRLPVLDIYERVSRPHRLGLY